MTDYHIEHSLVLATDYRVDDPEQMWSALKDRRDTMADLGTHTVVVYTSLRDPGRVMVTLGVRHRLSVDELIRSARFTEWFDVAGVADIPPVFAGEVVEKIAVIDDRDAELRAPGLVVSVVVPVADVAALMPKVHGALERFKRAGVRKVWVYRALDDPDEVMILHEIDTEANALRWVEHPDQAAEWMSSVGFPSYPPLFVGTLAHLMRIPAAGDSDSA